MVVFNNNEPLDPKLRVYSGSLYLKDYDYPLPEGLKTVKGNLYLDGYDHKLPEGLNVEGEVIVYDYNLTKHSLPGQLAVKVFERWAKETTTDRCL